MTKTHSRRTVELQQLPSLKALHIFSVASRCLNFSKAADELSITPSAVSHQIKRLEGALNCKLFEKKGKILYLTPEAEKFSIVINQCFTQMRDATRELTYHNKNEIQLGVNSAFAVKRLIPALGIWQEKYPKLDLRVRMISCEDSLHELDLDIILAGKFENSFYKSEFICDEYYYPVCSRYFAATVQGQNLKSIISNNTLIDLDGINIWSHWHKFKDLKKLNSSKIKYFSHTLLVIQAVLSGQGIALVDRNIIKNELNNGELVLLDDVGYVHPKTGYYLSLHNRCKTDTNVVNLRKWIRSMLL